MTGPRHFLDLDRLDATTLRRLFARAIAFKAGEHKPVMAGRTLALLFEKPSTRTRVSFEVGAHRLGGHAIVLNSRDMQLGRGETVADTARVLSRYVDAIVLRTDAHHKLLELARSATVPVINGLTDRSHPCQILADILTIEERKGDIACRRLAWVGDFNNVCRSLVHAAGLLGFSLAIACPPELLAGDEPALAWARAQGATVTVLADPREAVRGADAVFTDTWVSMSDREGERKRALLEPYRVDGRLMRLAAPDALFLHCLPAHRGEEVTDEVIDGPQSVVFDEAENRLYVQMAILEWCLVG
ncbi:Ornithine carbamoyltransferase [bacterium HR40]|nr:Ornithine carbamoyltransferase [bacterium HR40]